MRVEKRKDNAIIKKRKQIQITSRNKPLEIVQNYRYLGLEFNKRQSWEGRKRNRVQGR